MFDTLLIIKCCYGTNVTDEHVFNPAKDLGHEHTERQRQAASLKFCRLEMEGEGSIPMRQTKRQIQVYSDAAAAARCVHSFTPNIIDISSCNFSVQNIVVQTDLIKRHS